jgi:hypothetical protein
MKIISIGKCGECDCYKNTYGFRCENPKGVFRKVDPHTIHPDCPLEDAKEANR